MASYDPTLDPWTRVDTRDTRPPGPFFAYVEDATDPLLVANPHARLDELPFRAPARPRRCVRRFRLTRRERQS